jgi:hypothetical protein
MPQPGDFRVWWIPQVPMHPFHVPVKSIDEAKLVLQTLAEYDLFQLANNIKPDYANAGGLEMYETNFDGAGHDDWCEWSSEGDTIDDLINREREIIS